jgi:hypothetical protein
MIAVLVLALLGDDVESLLERLASPDIEAREEATSALRDLGDRAVPALLRARDSEDLEVRVRVAELLDRAAARASVDSISLMLSPPTLDARGDVLVQLSVSNSGPLPVILSRKSLKVLDLANGATDLQVVSGPRFVRLWPGETTFIDVAGAVGGCDVVLMPLYLHARCRMECRELAPENLALEGVRTGSAVSASPLAAKGTRIFKLKVCDSGETARWMQWLFPGALIADHARTNSVEVRAEFEILQALDLFVAAIERDPPTRDEDRVLYFGPKKTRP